MPHRRTSEGIRSEPKRARIAAAALHDDFAADDLAIAAEIVEVEPSLDPLALLAAAFRNSAYGIAIADARTNTLVAVNPAYAKLAGRSLEDIARQPIVAMYPPSEREGMVAGIARADRDGVAHFEGHIAHPDGSSEPVEGDIRVLRDKAGAPRYRIATLRSIRSRLDTERQLADAAERLRALARRLEDVQQAERKRIATALHEGLMQSLAGVGLRLEILKQRLQSMPAGAELSGEVANLQESLRVTTRSTRAVLDGFDGAGIQHLGLWSVVEHALPRWSESTGTNVTADLQERPALAEDVAIVAVRALHEALTNVARHAHATNVLIASRVKRRFVELTVEDDGIGIGPGDREKPEALGLLGVSERLRAFGGEVEVGRRAPRGTRVILRLPIPPATIRRDARRKRTRTPP